MPHIVCANVFSFYRCPKNILCIRMTIQTQNGNFIKLQFCDFAIVRLCNFAFVRVCDFGERGNI